MKKVLSALLSTTLLLTLIYPSLAFNQNGIFPDYAEIVQNEFYQNSTDAAVINDLSEKTIIHNGGKQINSDYFAEGQDNGNYLIAVTYIPIDGVIVETAHFTTSPSLSENEFIQIISDYETNLSSADAPAVSPRSTIRRFHWTFPDPEDNQTMASLTTAVTCDRKSSNSTVNGVRCSVWDVTSFSQLEKGNAIRMNNQYTRLSVDQPNEHLIAYGPSDSTSGGDITVGLDGAGVPSFSYTFNINGFSVRNLSSMTNEYGRWAFIDYVGNEREFTTKPGIRATNSYGDFVVELSHTVYIISHSGQGVEQSTGVLQIYVSDR